MLSVPGTLTDQRVGQSEHACARKKIVVCVQLCVYMEVSDEGHMCVHGSSADRLSVACQSGEEGRIGFMSV